MKFLCICQSGLGSSFMVQMNIQNILNDLGLGDEVTVEHSDVGSTTADLADYFFVESTLGDAVASLPQDKVVFLKSLIDQAEIREAVEDILQKEGLAAG